MEKMKTTSREKMRRETCSHPGIKTCSRKVCESTPTVLKPDRTVLSVKLSADY